MRRIVSTALFLVLIAQSSGAALASGAPLPSAPNLSNVSFSLKALLRNAETLLALVPPPSTPASPVVIGPKEAPYNVVPDIVQPVFPAASIPLVDNTIILPTVVAPETPSQASTSAARTPQRAATPRPLVTPPPIPALLKATPLPAPAAPSISSLLKSNLQASPMATAAPTGATTGVNHWWTYEEGSIPGAGRYMVNVANGNVLVQNDDVDVPERGIDLAFQRTFNSQSGHDWSNDDGSVPSNYGQLWTNTFDAHLVADSTNTNVTIYDIDGARYDWVCDSSGNCTPPPGMQGTTLHSGPSCTWSWTKKNGTAYQFYGTYADVNCGKTPLQDGRLRAIYGRNTNNNIMFTYTTDGTGNDYTHLSKILATHSDGHVMTLTFATFTGRKLLASVAAPGGITVTYKYDSSGRLIEADLPSNDGNASDVRPITYSYAGTNRITQAMGPRYTLSMRAHGGNVLDGGAVFFTYDANWRAAAIQDDGVVNFNPAGTGHAADLLQPTMPQGDQTWRETDFKNYDTGTTTLTDSDKHQTDWIFDSSGRVIQTNEYTDTAVLQTSATWDSENDLTSTTDANGNQTQYAYDTNGNTIAVALPLVSTMVITDAGGGLFSHGTTNIRPTSTYGYDANNNLVAYCDAVFNQNASYSYNWSTRPTASNCTAATAGATQYTWSSTGNCAPEPYGCLTSSVTPMNYRVDYTYNTSGLPTEVKADAAITQFAGAPPRQPDQTFTYDGYGDIATYDKGSGAWTLTYDSSNRLITVKDPDQVTSHTCYYANGQVEFEQSAQQNDMDGGAVCGAHSVAYTYDTDGDVVTEAHHYTCVKGQSCTPGVMNKWYDGDNRLIQVQQPQDASDVYANPWLTRYLYDISWGGSKGSIGVSGVSGMKAHGNLFDTQELLASGAPQWTYGASGQLSNSTWLDTAATQFDGLDRPIEKYQYVGDVPRTETLTYDSPSYLGELTKDCNALNVCKSFRYDTAGRPWEVSYSDSTPTEDTGFDADGRVASVNSSVFGMQAYVYDADGNKKYAYDPASGGVTGASQLKYGYYPDGKRSSVSIVAEGSGSTSRSNLFVYAYQTDGEPSTQQINLPTNTLVGTTALAYTYTAADRLKTRQESGPGANVHPITYTYNTTTGEMATADFPTTNGTPATFSYDAENEMVAFDNYTFQYSTRGELLHDPRGNNTVSEAYANGVKAERDGLTYSWDARRGAMLGSSDNAVDGSTSSYQYDTAGRMTGGGSSSSNSSNSYTRTYDGENHLLNYNASGGSGNTGYAVGTDYDWGPNGHPIRIGSTPLSSATGLATMPPLGPVKYDTLHWDGDQLLFTTDSSGAIDDIKIDDIADITPNDPTFGGITFWDRIGGSVAYCHNQTGGAGIGGTTAWHRGKVAGLEVSPCADPQNSATMPSSMEYLSSVSLGSAQAAGYVGVGQGGLLFMPGSDGINDGLNTIQGVRSYDPAAGTWTTPDAYAGDVQDPKSQKSYMWNDNNPVTYADPSGYAPAGLAAGGGILLEGACILIEPCGAVEASVAAVTAIVVGGVIVVSHFKEHDTNKTPSNLPKHQKGMARKQADSGKEKGDANRRWPRKPPPNHKGPWPPRPKNDGSNGAGSGNGSSNDNNSSDQNSGSGSNDNSNDQSSGSGNKGTLQTSNQD